MVAVLELHRGDDVPPSKPLGFLSVYFTGSGPLNATRKFVNALKKILVGLEAIISTPDESAQVRAN